MTPAMDMDEQVSHLQAMFPSIEGDVIAVVLNESEHNMDSTIEKLLWLSGMDTPTTSSLQSTPWPRPPDTHQAQTFDHSWSIKQPRTGNTGGGKQRGAKLGPEGSGRVQQTNSHQQRQRQQQGPRGGPKPVQPAQPVGYGGPMVAGSSNTEGNNYSFAGQSGFTGYSPYFYQTPSPYYYGYYGGLGSGGGGERPMGTEVQYGGGALFIPWMTADPLQGGDYPGGTGLGKTRATPSGSHDNHELHGNELRNRGSGQGRALQETQPPTSGRTQGNKNTTVTHTLPASPGGILPQGEGRIDRPAVKVVILRGLPGSGKSTLARQLVGTNGAICSTDQFFMMDGRYVFDPTKLSENHEKNKRKVLECLQMGLSPVIVDNTNVTAWEMKPYVDMAYNCGYEVEIREPDTPWKFKPGELSWRNSHRVPRQQIERMLDRWEPNVTVQSILNSRKSERKDVSSLKAGRSPNGSTSPGRQPRGGGRSYHRTPSPGPRREPSVGVAVQDHGWSQSRPPRFQRPPYRHRNGAERENRPAMEWGRGREGGSRERESSDEWSTNRTVTKPSFPSHKQAPQRTSTSKLSPRAYMDSNERALSPSLSSLVVANGQGVQETEAPVTGEDGPADTWSPDSDRRIDSSFLSPVAQPHADSTVVAMATPDKWPQADNHVNDPIAHFTLGGEMLQEESTSIPGLPVSELSAAMNPVSEGLLSPEQYLLTPPTPTPLSRGSPRSLLSPERVSDASIDDPVIQQPRQKAVGASKLNTGQPPHRLSSSQAVVMATVDRLESLPDGNPMVQEPLVSMETTKCEPHPVDQLFSPSLTEALSGEDLAPPPTQALASRISPSIADVYMYVDTPKDHNNAVESFFPTAYPSETYSQTGLETGTNLEVHSEVPNLLTSREETTLLETTRPEAEPPCPTVESTSEDGLGSHSNGSGPTSAAAHPLQSREAEIPLDSQPFCIELSLPVGVHAELDEDISNSSNFSHASNMTASSNPSVSSSSTGVQSEEFRGKASHSSEEGYNDLTFLLGCFPDEDHSYLRLLYHQCGGDVSATVARVLHSSTYPTTPQSSWVEDEASSTVSSTSYCSDTQSQPRTLTKEEAHGDATLVREAPLLVNCLQLDEDNKGGGASEEEEDFRLHLYQDLKDFTGLENEDSCINDAVIARVLQEQLNIEQEGKKTGPPSLKELAGRHQSVQHQEARGGVSLRITTDGMGGGADANLVLKLSPSLALQLQELFGAVEEYLHVPGELRDEDLDVLLSAKVAQGIHQKWVDTLKAKQAEYQYQQAKGLVCVPGKSPGDEISRPSGGEDPAVMDVLRRKRHTAPPLGYSSHRTTYGRLVAPPEDMERALSLSKGKGDSTPLSEIMTEQLVQQLEDEDVSDAVKQYCQDNTAGLLKVREICVQFPNLDRAVINRMLVRNEFNFVKSAAMLEKLTSQIDVDVTDGNTVVRSSSAPTFPAPTRPHRRKAKPQEPKATKPSARPAKEWHPEVSPLSYDGLRAEAALHAHLRAEAFQKAGHAWRKKQGELAAYYAQQGHMHTEKMREANDRAAQHILHTQDDMSSLDLHGLHVSEALHALETKLSTLTPGSTIAVITGRGSHSKGKEAKLKPAVVTYLKKNGFSYDEPNPGMLRVTLKG